MYEYRNLTPEEKEKLLTQRRTQGVPLHQPPQLQLDDQWYLLTAVCYEHQPHIHSIKRQKHLELLLFDQCQQRDMTLMGWVILPNHYHLLLHVPDTKELRAFFHKVHGSTSYFWNQEDDQRGRQVWYRYADRAIRSERHYYVTLNYIHFNPVKHNIVSSPYDVPCSSIHWYAYHQGQEWLQDCWRTYPIKDYGKSWDE